MNNITKKYKYILLLLKLSILFINCQYIDYNHIYKDKRKRYNSENRCQPFGERIFLGDYYNTMKDKYNLITIGVNTMDLCEDIQLFINYKQENQHIINFEYYNEIDTKKYSDTYGSNYLVFYTYFFSIPFDFLNQGEIFTYFAAQDNFDGENIQEYRVYLPFTDKQKQNEQIDRILIYGDYDANCKEQTSYNWGQKGHEFFMKQKDNIENRKFDYLLFLGDLAYELWDGEYQNSLNYFEKTAPYFGAIPQISTYGNHESGTGLEQYSYKFVDQYFKQPDFKIGQNRVFQFETQYAQFINFDCKTIWYDESQELQDQVTLKLEQQLILANRRREERPWIIVYSHYPIYYDDDEGKDFRRAKFKKIEDLFQKYKVDIYLSAHVHNYQRYLPLYNGIASQTDILEMDNGIKNYKNPKSTFYILDGSAGNSYFYITYPFDQRDILMSQDYSNPGASYLNIHNKTHISFEHFRFSNEQVTDKFWISKNYKSDQTYMILIIVSTCFILIISIFILLRYYLKNKQQQKITKAQLIDNFQQKDEQKLIGNEMEIEQQ